MSGLNGCPQKGANNLCNLLELQIDFRCNVVAYSYDISKMYTSLRMKACSLPFQLFLWKNGWRMRMRNRYGLNRVKAMALRARRRALPVATKIISFINYLVPMVRLLSAVM